ncbi:MAG: hypothetical protein AB9858_04925 [Acidaminococcaceae bacterium]
MMNKNLNVFNELKEGSIKAAQAINNFVRVIKLLLGKKKLRKKQILKLEKVYLRAFLAGLICFRQWYDLKLTCIFLGLHKLSFGGDIW